MKYIHHDTNAIDDEKLAELLIEFGYEGYGLFWAVLEKIAKQEKPVKTEVLKRQLKVGKRLEKCWLFMESIGLIYSSNGETFNKQLLNYAGSYKIKKEKNAKRISDWRERQRDTENVTRYEQNCNAPVTSLIEENRIEENRIESSFIGDAAPMDEKKTAVAEQPEPTNLETDSEEKKKSSAKRKKEDVTPHWKEMQEVWAEFFLDRHGGHRPSFNGECGTALKSILRRLQQHCAEHPKTKDEEWTAEYAERVFIQFLTKAYADPWRSQNFRLPTLSSHYDTIVTQNGQSTSKAGRTEIANADLANQLAEHYSGIAGKG